MHKSISHWLKERITKEERESALYEFQNMLETEGKFPRTPFLLLRSFKDLLELIGGALLGIMLGVFSVLIVFIVFVKLLHVL